MFRAFLAILALLALPFSLSAQTRPDLKPKPRPEGMRPEITFGDGGGNVEREITIGRNVVAGASGLVPGRLYDLLLLDDRGALVSMLRLSADREGSLLPSVLWYQSGVVGCGAATEEHLKQPHRFRTFEEAKRKLRGRAFTVELRDAARRGERPKPIVSRRLGISAEAIPTVYFSDRKGCLLNAVDGSVDVYITGRDFLRGTIADVAVAEHGEWRLGDPFEDVRPLKEKPQVVRLAAGATSFTVPAWRRGEMPVGTYDVVVRPYQSGSDRAVTPFIDYRDVIGWNGDVGIVVYDPNASHLVEQIAGRRVFGYPWFKQVDGFPLGTDVYGALDPKRKPPEHLGTYAAWYVVDHKAVWNNGDPLMDVSGGAEVTPIKAGCVNGTWTLLWPAPAPPNVNATTPTRPYDVIIDFGNLSQTEMGFVSDGLYTEGTDFVDYYGTVGFYLVRDPRLAGSFQVGEVEEPALNTPCNLDLDGIMITWTDPVFFPNQTFTVAIGDDDLGGEDGRCGSITPHLVEMRAHIWYPKDPNSPAVAPGGPYPVILFYHGQQQAALAGYEGYAYMGSLLASHGFIVYSVDARSTLNATIASRGEHIRAHMRKLVTLNQPGSGSIFEQHLDLPNTTIVGHSRGGDAVVAAWEWQRVQPDAGYTFKAVSAIAPVQKFNVWASEPQFLSHVRDVPYQIIHGGKDGDVSDFQGLRTYDRAADIRQAGQTPKSMVFVKDANHKNFNTVWAATVDDYCCGGIIPSADQQDTTRVYIHAFVQVYIKNRAEYIHFLEGTIPHPGAATVSIDFQRPANDVIVLDHHEVIAPEVHDKTLNAANGAITTNGIPDYDERALAATQPIPWSSYKGETFAGTLSWDMASDTYSTAIPPGVMTALDPAVMTHLAFRVGQVYRVGGPNPPNMNQNFAVRLRDTDGDLSPLVWVKDFAPVYPPWETMEGGIKTVMGLVRIPLQVFTVNTSSLVDLNKLDRIDFVFSGTPAGEIAFDDIRFTK